MGLSYSIDAWTRINLQATEFHTDLYSELFCEAELWQKSLMLLNNA
jgi:hypothetical protein